MEVGDGGRGFSACDTISVGPMGVEEGGLSPSLFKGRINKEMSL